MHFAGHSHYDAERSGAERLAARRRRAHRRRPRQAPSAAAPGVLELLRGGGRRRRGRADRYEGQVFGLGQRLPARRRRQLRRHVLGRARRREPRLRHRLLSAPRRGRSPRRRAAGGASGGRSPSTGRRRSPGRATSTTAIPRSRRSRRARAARRPLAALDARREPARFSVSLGGSRRGARGAAGAASRAPRRPRRRARAARRRARRGARAASAAVVVVSGPPGDRQDGARSTRFSRGCGAPATRWVAQGEPSSSTAPARRTCRSSRRSAGSAATRGRPPPRRAAAPRRADAGSRSCRALVEPRRARGAARAALGATRERMLRELAELFEVRPRSARWSSCSRTSTGATARRSRRSRTSRAPRRPARLLLLGTYRPAEVMRGEHPLRAVTQELRASRPERGDPARAARRAAVDDLSPRALRRGARSTTRVARARPSRAPRAIRSSSSTWSISRCARRLPRGAAAGSAHRGGAGPLSSAIPEGLRPMIERQIESLSVAEQRTLEAAAVAGAEFSVAAVAAALEAIPTRSTTSARDRRGVGTSCARSGWRSGPTAPSRGATPSCTRSTATCSMSDSRRRAAARLHRRIGERKEEAWGAQADEIAGELAPTSRRRARSRARSPIGCAPATSRCDGMPIAKPSPTSVRPRS